MIPSEKSRVPPAPAAACRLRQAFGGLFSARGDPGHPWRLAKTRQPRRSDAAAGETLEAAGGQPLVTDLVEAAPSPFFGGLGATAAGTAGAAPTAPPVAASFW